jgi:hypothetical protein
MQPYLSELFIYEAKLDIYTKANLHANSLDRIELQDLTTKIH